MPARFRSVLIALTLKTHEDYVVNFAAFQSQPRLVMPTLVASINWMFQVAEDLKLSDRALHVGINFVYRYLSRVRHDHTRRPAMQRCC
jgi:hypothetical protein